MSEVYGRIGDQDVRLKGMASESVQEEILRVLSQIGASKAIGLDAKELGKGSVAANVLAKALEEIPGPTGKAAKGLNSLGEFFEGQAWSAIRRTVRGFDTNINDTSFGFRSLSMTGGKFGAVMGFAAESVSQLSEQFDQYRKMANIGGAVATDFDDLRVRATELGMSLPDLVETITNNAEQLRYGGNSVRGGLTALIKETQALRKDPMSEELTRIGIPAGEFGKQIVKVTGLMGGLTAAQNKYGEGFTKQMIDATKSANSLSAAFGFNREQIMQAANEAMKKADARTMYNQIQAEGKEQVLLAFTGLFKGDSTKAMEATITYFTDRMTDSAADMFAANNKIIPALGKYAETVKTLGEKEALLQSGLGGVLEGIDRSKGQLSNSILGVAGAVEDNMRYVIDFKDAIGDASDIQRRVNEIAKGNEIPKTPDTVSALGELQKSQISMAKDFAITNKSLNIFGLSVARTASIMIKAGGLLAGATAGGAGKVYKDTGLQGMVEDVDKYLMNMGDDVGEWLYKKIGLNPSADQPQPIIPTSGVINPLNNMIVTSKVGQRGDHFHKGVDLQADVGTDVRAPEGGTVRYTPNAGNYGNMVEILNDQGKVMHRLAHLSESLVKDGVKVQPGQVIAKSGNTGRSTGPHLHWERYDANGKLIDPMSVMPNEKNRAQEVPKPTATSVTQPKAEERKEEKKEEKKDNKTEVTTAADKSQPAVNTGTPLNNETVLKLIETMALVHSSNSEDKEKLAGIIRETANTLKDAQLNSGQTR